MKKKNRSQMWPMEYILGGILTIAVIVLLSYGLRTEDEAVVEPLASGPGIEESGSALDARPVVEPDQGRPTVIEVALNAPPVPPEEAQPAPAAAEAVPEPVNFAEAEALYQAGDYDAAAESFSTYADENPDNPWGHYMLGLSEHRLGRHAEAEAALRAAIAIEPDRAKSWINLSRVLMAAGQGEPALAAAERGVALDPASAPAARVLGRALHDLGLADEALAAYSNALSLDPRDEWALNNLGLILIEQQRFLEALEPLALAASLDDRVAVFQNNLGVALEASGYPAAASLAYLRALEADPDHGKAETNLARAELQDAESVSPELASLSEGLETRIAQGIFPWLRESELASSERDLPGSPVIEAEAASVANEAPVAKPIGEELPPVAESATGL